jgi:hypothetical protein
MYRVPSSRSLADYRRYVPGWLAWALFACLLLLAFVLPEKDQWAMRSTCPDKWGVYRSDGRSAPAGVSWRKQHYGWPVTFKVYEIDLCAKSEWRDWTLAGLAFDALLYLGLAVIAAWLLKRLRRWL